MKPRKDEISTFERLVKRVALKHEQWSVQKAIEVKELCAKFWSSGTSQMSRDEIMRTLKIYLAD